MKTRATLIVALASFVLPPLASRAKADPMRPLTPPAAAASAVAPAMAMQVTIPAGGNTVAIHSERLVAIRRDSEGRYQALLGERWVGPGSKAGNATVRSVDDNSVTLALGRQSLVLHVLPQLIATQDAATERPGRMARVGSPVKVARQARPATTSTAAPAPVPTASVAAAPPAATSATTSAATTANDTNAPALTPAGSLTAALTPKTSPRTTP